MLRAGVGKHDITTDEAGVRVNDPLQVKALVLDDGTSAAAIVAMDALAIGGIGDVSDAFLPEFRRRVEAELGIPGANVLVNASHTHPQGRLLCDDEQQLARACAAVRQARESMVPARVGSGTGRESRISVNRDLAMRDGSHWSIRYAHPGPPDRDVAAVGPIDPDIGIIRVDRLDGGVVAVVYNFACHPLIGVPSGAITANFPGFASGVLEETLDGAMALFVQGAGGDIVEAPFKDVSRPRDCEPLGVMLGLSALRAVKQIQTTANVTLSIARAPLMLPRKRGASEQIARLRARESELLTSLRGCALNLKTFLPLYLRHALDADHPSEYAYRYLHQEACGDLTLTSLDSHNERHIANYMRNIEIMEQLCRIEADIAALQSHEKMTAGDGRDSWSSEVQAIRIGDCAVVSAPVEPLVEVGLNVKRMSPYKNTIVAGYSNGYWWYGPPADNYAKGGYETMECRLAPEWQEAYQREAHDLLLRLSQEDSD